MQSKKKNDEFDAIIKANQLVDFFNLPDKPRKVYHWLDSNKKQLYNKEDKHKMVKRVPENIPQERRASGQEDFRMIWQREFQRKQNKIDMTPEAKDAFSEHLLIKLNENIANYKATYDDWDYTLIALAERFREWANHEVNNGVQWGKMQPTRNNLQRNAATILQHEIREDEVRGAEYKTGNGGLQNKPSYRAIALLHHYTNEMITVENMDTIARKFLGGSPAKTAPNGIRIEYGTLTKKQIRITPFRRERDFNRQVGEYEWVISKLDPAKGHSPEKAADHLKLLKSNFLNKMPQQG